MPKSRETADAIYYRTDDPSAQILTAINAASQQVTSALLKKQLEIATMKQAFATLDPEAQQQLFDSWSEREKRQYGVKPRAKTEAEKADERTRIAQAGTAEANLARQPLLTQELQQRVDEGKITLGEAQRLNNIINDPNADMWDKAFAQGLRGEDAERFVLNKKYPELADSLMQVRNKVGPEYEKRLVSEYFGELTKESGQVDPKYTLLTAKALAKAVATGDVSELDKLNADPKWPQSMETLAFKRFKLDRDQLNQSRADRLSNERQTQARLTVQLMEMYGGAIQADAASQAAKALLEGKDVPEWTRPQLARAREAANAQQQAQVADMQMKVSERVAGIPEIRSSIETLQKLQKEEIGGDNEQQIKTLRNELIQRMSRLYDVDPAQLEDKDGFWGRVFNGVTGFASTAGQTGAALAGDALAGRTDPLMDLLAADETPGALNDGTPIRGKPMPPGHGSSPLSFRQPAVAPGGRTLATAPGAPQSRKQMLRTKAESLLSEAASATPERKMKIRELLAAIRQDPEGLAALTEAVR